MKKYIFPILAFILFSCQEKKTLEQPVQTDTIATPTTERKTSVDVKPAASDPIASIRAKVEAINNADLQKKHYEFMCDEKMKVDYFYEDGAIVKIAIDFGTVGDVYAKEDYYYDNGKLVFFYEFVEGGPACEGCIKTNEYRSYIVNDQTIRYLKDQTEMACRKCSFTTSSKPYRLLAETSQQAIKKVMCN